ncbi:zinc-dependent alcohol dehydrogenase [Arthrobacter sp. U41]|uniref:zinc-dependent alcohol dehydrogenase n=1 Tax=Arthrobacter sp. U41 TaxID=1849032 RepID=UPI0008593838|nr:zinc-binding alcohol dehydrogenase [Arthrobacter sp. U41]AOT05453.1 dehydrogenase [Arthrobacter sp. U41]
MSNSDKHPPHTTRHTTATAYWTVGPGKGELRRGALPLPGPGEALVRTLYSGISKGTELVVHNARVPQCVAEEMAAPNQEGSFPSPVKFGYLSVGVVEDGPANWMGKMVFCLYPHQDRYVVPVESLTVVPDDVPARRAVLTGTVETAINGIWEAGPRLGDRVAVIGAGLVGGMVAKLLGSFPLGRLQLVDVDPAKRAFAAALGVEFSHPDDALPDCDIVIHCSASEAGLARALQLAGDDADVIEMSWYADRKVTVPLGEDFHARRLSIRASQVGVVARARRHRRTNADRLQLAVSLLRDPGFDVFLTGSSTLGELPDIVQQLSDGTLDALCHVIDYAASRNPAGADPATESAPTEATR